MGELVCDRCGDDYPVWWVRNDIWNSVMGNEGGGFLCVTCFVLAAVAKGHGE